MRPTPPIRLAVAAVAALAATLAAALLAAPPAQAATLTQVTGFGANPGALQMYSYRPDGLGTGAPLVVALHGCTQSASDYHTHAGWQKYADLWRFTVVYPQTTSANNANSCFNWFATADSSRGQGEALSIKQMVDYAVTTYGADRTRVYVTGLSAGGAMSAVMLATYPDVFAAGSIVAGIPYRCATDLPSGLTCQNSAQARTPAQWGDLVRAADPGYGGPWPRVAIWYGTSDTTVSQPANPNESRDQWTNVWGIGQSASSTATLSGGTTLANYDAAGTTVVRLYTVPGIAHGTPVNPGAGTDQCGTTGTYYLASICEAYHDAVFFGLSGGTPPPPTSPPPTGACFTTDNYHQVAAGRAHQSLGQVYANGSNQAMGLWNVFVTHTLRQTGTNVYVLADGQC